MVKFLQRIECCCQRQEREREEGMLITRQKAAVKQDEDVLEMICRTLSPQ